MALRSALAVILLFIVSNTVSGACTVSDFKSNCLFNQTGGNRATYFDGFCWILHPQFVTYSVAQAACTSEHSDGRLALLTNRDQLEALKYILDVLSSAWVGLERDPTQPEPNGWQLVEGSGAKAYSASAFDLRAPGQYTVGGGVHAVVNHAGLTNQDEGTTHPFLCQIPEPPGCPNRACFNPFNVGIKGSIAQGDTVMDTVSNVNIQSCGRLCAEEPKCQSFAHSRNTQTCQLYWLDAKDLSLDADPDSEIMYKHTIETDCQHLTDCKQDTALLFFGTNSVAAQTTVEIFHPDHPVSNPIESLPDGRLGSAAALVAGNTVLLCGGLASDRSSPSCYYYYLDSRAFVAAPSMLIGRSFAGSLLFEHHNLLVCGGKDGSGNAFAQCEKYSTTTQSWQSIPSMNLARFAFGFAQADELIYAVGGRGATFYSSVERFDSKTNQWTFVASLPVPVMWHSAATLDGYVFSCGGRDNLGSQFSSCWKYDPETDVWMAVADMINARIGHKLVVFNRKLMVIGGNGHKGVEIYDKDTDAWMLSAVDTIEIRSTGPVVVV